MCLFCVCVCVCVQCVLDAKLHHSIHRVVKCMRRGNRVRLTNKHIAFVPVLATLRSRHFNTIYHMVELVL